MTVPAGLASGSASAGAGAGVASGAAARGLGVLDGQHGGERGAVVPAPAREPTELAVIVSHSTRLRASQRSGPTLPAGSGEMASAAARRRDRRGSSDLDDQGPQEQGPDQPGGHGQQAGDDVVRGRLGQRVAAASRVLRLPRSGDVPKATSAAGRPTTMPASTASAISARVGFADELHRRLP